MKKYVLVTLMCLLGLSSIAQEKVYLNSENVEVKEKHASKYWLIEDAKDNQILFKEYSLEGVLQIQGYCLKTDYTYYDGVFFSYHENGTLSEEYTYIDDEFGEILNAWDEEGNAIDIVYSFARVEVKPVFPGGDAALLKFLAENVHYPKEAWNNGISGRVFLQFVINEDGKVTNVEVLRGVDELLDKEAIKVVSLIPDWSPGLHQGAKVKVSYIVPINFKL